MVCSEFLLLLIIPLNRKIHFIFNFKKSWRWRKETWEWETFQVQISWAYLSVKMSILSHPPFSTLPGLAFLSSCLCPLTFSFVFVFPGAQKGQIQPVWAQLQCFQQWGGWVSHGQKDPIVHHRPSIWSVIHVSQINPITSIKLFIHYTPPMLLTVHCFCCCRSWDSNIYEIYEEIDTLSLWFTKYPGPASRGGNTEMIWHCGASQCSLNVTNSPELVLKLYQLIKKYWNFINYILLIKLSAAFLSPLFLAARVITQWVNCQTARVYPQTFVMFCTRTQCTSNLFSKY